MAKVNQGARPDPLAPVGAAFEALSGAAALLRERLAAIDPLDHPTRWAGVNDQIRGIEDRCTALRDEQQRIALAHAQMRELGLAELSALQEATTKLATLVRAAGQVAAVAEAAGGLIAATSAAITKLRG